MCTLVAQQAQPVWRHGQHVMFKFLILVCLPDGNRLTVSGQTKKLSATQCIKK